MGGSKFDKVHVSCTLTPQVEGLWSLNLFAFNVIIEYSTEGLFEDINKSQQFIVHSLHSDIIWCATLLGERYQDRPRFNPYTPEQYPSQHTEPNFSYNFSCFA